MGNVHFWPCSALDPGLKFQHFSNFERAGMTVFRHYEQAGYRQCEQALRFAHNDGFRTNIATIVIYIF
jgi:hypothetical protein